MAGSFIKPTNVYAEIEERRKELNDVLRVLEKNSLRFPNEDIRIVQSGSRVQFYLRKTSEDKNGRYLPKSEEKKVQVLLQKKYENAAIKVISSEIIGLEKCLKLCDSQSHLQELYAKFPEKVKKLIKPIALPEEDYIKLWNAKDYIGKPLPSDIPVFVSDKGDHVRSKSELNIANTLYKLGVPYKYECPLTLKRGYTIYPDFTVLNVKTRREIYWEHRGMMDDKEYSNHSVVRLRDYEKAGVFLGERLIITEETSATPLGTAEIEMTIKHYLMS